MFIELRELRGERNRTITFTCPFISISGRVTEKLGFNGRSDGDRIGSTAIVALFGGLASEATGGDFAEGALRAAFVHLFNELATEDCAGKKIFYKNQSSKKNILYFLKAEFNLPVQHT